MVHYHLKMTCLKNLQNLIEILFEQISINESTCIKIVTDDYRDMEKTSHHHIMVHLWSFNQVC